jgi:hypothetical protein
MKILSVGVELLHENTDLGPSRTGILYETEVCSSQFCERGAEN